MPLGTAIPARSRVNDVRDEQQSRVRIDVLDAVHGIQDALAIFFRFPCQTLRFGSPASVKVLAISDMPSQVKLSEKV